MRFTSIIPALLGVLPGLTSARALPDTSASDPNYSLYCALSGPAPYNGYSCSWTLGERSALKCTCNIPQPGQTDLCHFFSNPYSGGWEYIGYGQYGTCYNLEYLYWANDVMMTLGNTAGCRIYSQADCAGPYATVDSTNVAKFPYSHVGSYICNEPGYIRPPPPYPLTTPSPAPIPSSIYVPPAVPPKSSSSKDGGIVTPTLPPYSYVPLPVYSKPSSSKDGGDGTPTPTATPKPSSSYIPPKLSSSTSSVINTLIPTLTPSYITHPESSSSKDGGINTPTLPTVPIISPILPTSVYMPPVNSISSKDGGISTPTPMPTLSSLSPILPTSINITPPYVSPPKSTSTKDGGVSVPDSFPTSVSITTPTIPTSIYVPTLPPPKSTSLPLPPPQKSSSTSKSGGNLNTPAPTPTPYNPYYGSGTQPPPPPPPPTPAETPYNPYNNPYGYSDDYSDGYSDDYSNDDSDDYSSDDSDDYSNGDSYDSYGSYGRKRNIA